MPHPKPQAIAAESPESVDRDQQSTALTEDDWEIEEIVSRYDELDRYGATKVEGSHGCH